MSKQVKGITLIRDVLILKKTLQEMGISFHELNAESLTFGTGYDKVTVHTDSGQVQYDEMRHQFIDDMQKTYSKNQILNEIAIKGHRVESVRQVGANIEIIASY
jgi:hypothetical protein